jgi:predicted nucleic acid-binding protein
VRFLLDTNVVSEARKGSRANPGVLAWLAATPASSLWTSVLVLGELRRGVESLRRRDPVSAGLLDRWLRDHRSAQAERILQVDEAVALRWGLLNVPDPVPTVDGLLAATALVHGMTLVTRNSKDVARTGATVHNPFTAAE